MKKETHSYLLASHIDGAAKNTQDHRGIQTDTCAQLGRFVRCISDFPSALRRPTDRGGMDGSIDTHSGRELSETGALRHRAMTERASRGLLRPELLSYRILTPRRCGLADVPLLGEAYRCWSAVWTDTLRELDGANHIPSDDFTRQDEVGAIFHGYECIALSCFRWIDMSNPMYRDDSYFNIWPEDARNAACRDGYRVCIGSHITVSPAWRKTPVRNLLTALTIDRSSFSDADALLGTMRDDRGMARLVAGLGADTLGHATLHGVPVTLIAVYRTSVRPPLDAKTEELVRSLRDAIPRGGKQ